MKLTPDSKDFPFRLLDRMAHRSGVSAFGYAYGSSRLQAIIERNAGQLTVSVYVDLEDLTSILVVLPDGSRLSLKASGGRIKATTFRDHVADLKAAIEKLPLPNLRRPASGPQLMPMRPKQNGTSD